MRLRLRRMSNKLSVALKVICAKAAAVFQVSPLSQLLEKNNNNSKDYEYKTNKQKQKKIRII